MRYSERYQGDAIVRPPETPAEIWQETTRLAASIIDNQGTIRATDALRFRDADWHNDEASYRYILLAIPKQEGMKFETNYELRVFFHFASDDPIETYKFRDDDSESLQVESDGKFETVNMKYLLDDMTNNAIRQRVFDHLSSAPSLDTSNFDEIALAATVDDQSDKIHKIMNKDTTKQAGAIEALAARMSGRKSVVNKVAQAVLGEPLMYQGSILQRFREEALQRAITEAVRSAPRRQAGDMDLR